MCVEKSQASSIAIRLMQFFMLASVWPLPAAAQTSRPPAGIEALPVDLFTTRNKLLSMILRRSLDRCTS